MAVVGIVAIGTEGAAQTLRPASGDDPTTGIFWLSVCDDSRGEDMCTGYFRGLVDMNEMFTLYYKKPLWCAPSVRRLDQIKLVVIKGIREHPEELHLPFMGLAIRALSRAFPCARSSGKPRGR